MLKLDSKTCRILAWAIIGIILVLIICTFRDYGITWDEELQSQYGQAVADYYASGFKDMRYAEIFNLYLYGGMFDGLAAVVDHYSPLRVYDTRHLLNALFGLLGLIGTWRLGRLLSGGVVGLMALVLCATVPSYYGHMFNNPKDIPFAAGIVWSIYYMVRLYGLSVEKGPRRDVLIKLGVIFGLTLGIRVGGAMLFAFWLAPMGITALLPLWINHDSATLRSVWHNIWQLGLKLVLPAGLLAYAVMLLCWPWAQQHPIANPLRALSEFSNFPQDVEVLLDGTTYRSTELPWYYVPLYFGIQLPEFLLFLLAVSIPFLPKTWARMASAQKQGFALVCLMMLLPTLYAVIRHPALYDTVRHFLFVVPLASIIAALTARTALVWCQDQFDQTSSKKLITAGFALAACLWIGTQIVTMIRLHPYEYIYANQFTGGVRGAYGKYESDYWGTSFKEAAQDIQDLVAKEGGVPPGKIFKIAICGPWDAALIYLPPDYEPVVANEPAEFFLSTTRWMCQNMRPGKEVIRVQRMDVPLAIVKDLRGGYEHYEGNEHENKK